MSTEATTHGHAAAAGRPVSGSSGTATRAAPSEIRTAMASGSSPCFTTTFQPAWQAAATRTAAKTKAAIGYSCEMPGNSGWNRDWLIYYPIEGDRMLTTPLLIVIALCAALNFSIGTIVYLIKLPIYLDSIGTILCALLIGADRKLAF